ncbi:hypothetical protein AJ88_18615 [Mesorhizobium amorphae CCBAU 01583]|nr:hypothetical protein AJ88_18615 [Mesorhizobium amorphae CCBAU 01583]
MLLNEKLTTELRPTLFLAQLSNLLAGNISIVHKVTGSSRTFMGEEGAGVAAVETAAARIRSGQSTHVLVGGAFQTEHSDMLLGYELAGYLHRGAWKPVWQRQGGEGGGVVTGSGGAFLVLEQREHAKAVGARSTPSLARSSPDAPDGGSANSMPRSPHCSARLHCLTVNCWRCQVLPALMPPPPPRKQLSTPIRRLQRARSQR